MNTFLKSAHFASGNNPQFIVLQKIVKNRDDRGKELGRASLHVHSLSVSTVCGSLTYDGMMMISRCFPLIGSNKMCYFACELRERNPPISYIWNSNSLYRPQKAFAPGVTLNHCSLLQSRTYAGYADNVSWILTGCGVEAGPLWCFWVNMGQSQ